MKVLHCEHDHTTQECERAMNFALQDAGFTDDDVIAVIPDRYGKYNQGGMWIIVREKQTAEAAKGDRR